jgi:hypothetical protein
VFKLKKEKEIKIEEDVKEREDEIQNHVMSGLAYEKLIREVLNDLNLEYHSSKIARNYGYDFLINTKDSSYVIEAKYYSRDRKISGSVVQQIFNLISKINRNGILVANCDLTNSAANAVANFNKNNKDKSIYIVKGETKEELLEGFNKIFK